MLRADWRLVRTAWFVCALQDGDKQETDRNYEDMWRQLRSVVGIGQRVQLIKLVCNHRSFAQTVENIFTLSFLVSCYGGPVLVTTQVTRHTCGRSCRPVEAAVFPLWSRCSLLLPPALQLSWFCACL